MPSIAIANLSSSNVFTDASDRVGLEFHDVAVHRIETSDNPFD